MNKRNLWVAIGAVVLAAVAIVIITKSGKNDQMAAVLRADRNCVRATPTLAISPAAQNGYQNQILDYQVSLTNNDSAACKTSYFNVLPYPEGNMAGRFYAGDASMYVDPGVTRSRTVLVTPPTGTAAGTYGFVYRAINGTLALSGASNTYPVISAPAKHTVLALSDTTAPTAPTDLNVVATSSSSVKIAWTAGTDNIGVQGYKIVIDGRRTESFYPSPTWAFLPDFSAGQAHAITLQTVDYAGNVSAPVLLNFTTKATADTTAPSKPSNVRAESITKNSATFVWAASTDNNYVESYQVTAAGNTTPNGETLLCQVSAPTTSCTYGGLMPDTSYTIQVGAYDMDGNEAVSQQARFKTLR